MVIGKVVRNLVLNYLRLIGGLDILVEIVGLKRGRDGIIKCYVFRLF